MPSGSHRHYSSGRKWRLAQALDHLRVLSDRGGELRERRRRRSAIVRGDVRSVGRLTLALAQNPANTGAFKAKPHELPRGAPVDCTPNFGCWGWKNGSSGRIRTYNPSVNSRMLYH